MDINPYNIVLSGSGTEEDPYILRRNAKGQLPSDRLVAKLSTKERPIYYYQEDSIWVAHPMFTQRVRELTPEEVHKLNTL